METIKLTIFDETLRDGEQQVGIFFDDTDKSHLVNAIAQTGVQYLALMPAIHHSEKTLVKNLISNGFQQQIVASTMMGKHFIDLSLECGVKTIILFHAISDRLLWLRDPEIRRHRDYQQKTIDDAIPPRLIAEIRQRMLDKVLANLQYAANKGLKICFAAEDASRADFDFLVECISKFQPYIDHFLLCDTVGILNPETTKFWIRNLVEFSGDTSLVVHFHNDRGLALDNTIQAVLAGATGISGTFGGIGERAGNVALEQVIYGLKLRYGWEIEGINDDALHKVTKYLGKIGIRANNPYSPEAQRYETGIHVNSILRDRASYYVLPYGQPEIWFGKFSGASNFEYLFEHHLNRPLPKEKYQEFREIIKSIAIQQKCSFSAEEVLKILRQQEILDFL
jgi:isopropylmalate/homocitrate/citramalate synthase